jgi:hypothetical protein
MKTKTPSSRRKFANAGDEINYLRDKLLYWLYERGAPRKARAFGDRLGPLLERGGLDGGTILGEECRSLIAETRGDLVEAIRHRENEVRLIEHLHRISADTPHWGVIRRAYDYDDLSDRLDLLAILYHDSGQLQRAISTLQGSKQLCERHGMRFDGRALLTDYLKEKEGQARSNKTSAMPRRTGTTGR